MMEKKSKAQQADVKTHLFSGGHQDTPQEEMNEIRYQNGYKL